MSTLMMKMKILFKVMRQCRQSYYYRCGLLIFCLLLWFHLSTFNLSTFEGQLQNPNIKFFAKYDNILENVRAMDILPPIEPMMINGAWQVSNDPTYEIYLHSAIYDDRKERKNPTVRITAIIQDGVQDMMCLMWYRKVAKPDVVKATWINVGKGTIKKDKTFKSVLLACDTSKGNWPPDSVSIITKNALGPSSLLPVEVPPIHSSQKDFLACVPILQNIPEPKLILEWLSLLGILGVDKVVMYDNGYPENITKVLQYFVNENFVDLHKTPDCVTTKNKNMTSLSVPLMINDCLYKNMYKYNYVTVLNADEIIVPRNGSKSYYELLEKIRPKFANDEGGLAYIIKNANFFTDMTEFDDSFSHYARYLQRVQPNQDGRHARSFTDPKLCLVLGESTCAELLDTTSRTWKIDVSETFALSHHYQKCNLDDEYQSPGLCNRTLNTEAEMDTTMLQFLDQIYQKISKIAMVLNIPIGSIDENSLMRQEEELFFKGDFKSKENGTQQIENEGNSNEDGTETNSTTTVL